MAVFTGVTAVFAANPAEAAARCPEPAPAAGEAAAHCDHVFRLRCHGPNRTFTGFRTRVRDRIGIVTALHAVVDCNRITANNRRLSPPKPLVIHLVDKEHDAAFLTAPGLGDQGLATRDDLGTGRLRVLGYALGAFGQAASYLEREMPARGSLRAMLPTELIPNLARRNSPAITTEVIRFNGALNRGHSGAPILTPAGHVVGFGDGGLKHLGSDRVWAIPVHVLTWSPDVESVLAELSGQETQLLAAHGSAAAPVRLPPVYLADAADRTGPIFKRVDGDRTIAFTWGEGTIYSVATAPDGRIFFSNHNDNHLYEMTADGVRRIYTHDTYTRDVAVDPVGRLYFSESSGAGGDGTIWRLDGNRARPYFRVRLDKVDGFWAGRFNFDPNGYLWLASGNVVPANLYRVANGNPELKFTASSPIAGFDFVDEQTLVFTDWHQNMRQLRLPGMTPVTAFPLGFARHLSDIAVIRHGDQTKAGEVIGYLIVPGGSSVETVKALRPGMTLCGTPGDLARLGHHPRLRGLSQVRISAGEVYQALQTGACSAWLVADDSRISRILGGDARAFRRIPIRR